MSTAPPITKYLKEVRVIGEFARFWLSDANADLPRGDGHPVIVYPGMLSSDATTSLLRARLSALGYEVHGWEQGPNLGPQRDVLSELRSQLVRVTQAAGRRASLFGWSLGGIYARELAKRRPDCVRLIVTAGTPCMGDMRWTNAWRTYERLNGHPVDDPPFDTDISELPQVPVTSIYSEDDGIVSPHCTRIGEGARHETVMVDSSHMGMVWSVEVLAVTADRLAQAEGAWAPYQGNVGKRVREPVT